MKRCPECRRDYHDDMLSFCLEDGTPLVQGSVRVGNDSSDEPQTAILSEPGADRGPQTGSPAGVVDATGFPHGEERTRPQIHTTDQTAIFPRIAEAEPQRKSEELSERQSLSAHRAAKPLVIIGVVAVLLISGFFGYRYFATSSKQIESIAVMPFVNDSGNADVEYLSDGMTETLIRSLSQLPNLNVKARSSVFRYKGKDTDAKTIGSELGVQAILTGRLIQRGDRLSLNLELTDVRDETVIWADNYERRSADLVTLQNDIARDISDKLSIKLSGKEQTGLTKRPTENAEAFRLYLLGRYEWNKRQRASLLRAVDFLKQAIVLDPGFALAYAGLADCYVVFNSYEVAQPSESYPQARIAAQKALELDPGLAEAYASLAAVNEDFDWDFASAERNYRKAIEIDPNYAIARQWFGEYLRIFRRFDEAIAEGERSIGLDPVSLPANNSYGITLFFANRCDEAIAQQNRTIALDPSYPWPHTRLADCYASKGMYKEAFAGYQRTLDLTEGGVRPSWVLAHYAYALARSGDYAGAHRMLEELREKQKKEFVEGDHLALVYYSLSDIDNTFAELDRGYRERSPGVRYISVDPRYEDSFRADPRYRELVRKIGVPR